MRHGGWFACRLPALSVLVFLALPATTGQAEPGCSYSTWEWDTIQRKSVGHRTVRKARAELTPEEVHAPTGCTVCSEDQVTVRVAGAPPVRVCHLFADEVRGVLEFTMASGFPLHELVGYRVGRTKGPPDAKGLRTRFSNHSFGIAVDINPALNGLYNNCVRFGPECRLSRGGPWRPGVPGTVTRDSVPYLTFTAAGWKWAGELRGRQKDFMHFSLSGD